MRLDRREWKLRCREFCARGEQLGHSKLTDAKVREIRAAHVLNSRTHGAPALARRYALHVRTIEKVLSYKTWSHVR